MNVDEVYALEHLDADPERLITGEDLRNRNPRTLIYGYDCDRSTFVTYLEHTGKITVTLDDKEVAVTCNQDYVPNKRVYFEKSDYEFCRKLILAGVNIAFTTHSRTDGLTMPGIRAGEGVSPLMVSLFGSK